MVITIESALSGTIYATLLAALITAIQIVYHSLKVGKAGPKYMEASLRYLAIKREIIYRLPTMVSDNQVDSFLAIKNQELDELDMGMYNLGYGPSNMKWTAGHEGIDFKTENDREPEERVLTKVNIIPTGEN